ncbi:MAG: hypothetical protein AAF705_01260 [Bacteroidota bacterium]
MYKRYITISVLFLIYGCTAPQEALTTNPTFRVQKVAKGNHFTQIMQRYWLPIKAQSFTIKAKMEGPGLNYNIGPADQNDINKFGGFYGKKYRPHAQSSIQGFWNDLEKGQMAWTFYHHGIQNVEDYRAVGSVPGYVNLNNVLYTNRGEVPDFHVYFESRREVHLAMTYQNQSIRDTIYFENPVDRWISLGNLYMGGNVPAQDWVKAYKAVLKYNSKTQNVKK